MPVYDFSCQCGWSGEMLVRGYNDAPPLCPQCGQPTRRLFSPTTALYIAEWSRTENIDAMRRYATRLEKDEQLRKREQRAQEYARRLSERLEQKEAHVPRETIDSIIEAGRVR